MQELKLAVEAEIHRSTIWIDFKTLGIIHLLPL